MDTILAMLSVVVQIWPKGDHAGGVEEAAGMLMKKVSHLPCDGVPAQSLTGGSGEGPPTFKLEWSLVSQKVP